MSLISFRRRRRNRSILNAHGTPATLHGPPPHRRPCTALPRTGDARSARPTAPARPASTCDGHPAPSPQPSPTSADALRGPPLTGDGRPPPTGATAPAGHHGQRAGLPKAISLQ
ncbi:hypothetical protein PVAP13_1NG300819 [Panicum virgatum]|uniref:Uncharacterized protein n=1 Tax=Panicum virgatum TaxID=38727 RepID=A0A8T0WWK3_PANVG|nr:hypothetical protein PVAP13_1NG300819 [Panicum virgatum]